MYERTKIEDIYLNDLQEDLRFCVGRLCVHFHRGRIRPEKLVCVICLEDAKTLQRIWVDEIYLDNLKCDLALLVKKLRFSFNNQNVQVQGLVCSVCSEEVTIYELEEI